MTSSADLIAGVRAAAAETPYVVDQTPQGFTLRVDLADAKWLTLAQAHGLKKVHTYEVTLDEAQQRFSVVDHPRTVSWDAGGTNPRLEAEFSTFKGQTNQFSMGKKFGFDLKTGQVGTPVDYAFNSESGRNLIRGVASGQGWTETAGPTGQNLNIGLILAIVGGSAVLLALVALVVALAS